MDQASTGQFVHRENRDGTYDSICRECFATVATAGKEERLAEAEKAHVGNPGERRHFEHHLWR